MKDREMLEWAARAAGYDVKWSQEYPNGGALMKRVIPEPPEPCSKRAPWSPLHDDGDALRLLVSLLNDDSRGLHLDIYKGAASARISPEDGTKPETEGICRTKKSYGSADDMNEAVRYAITEAAARIGKAMEQKG